MNLKLESAKDVILLAVILRTIREGQPVKKVLKAFVEKSDLPRILEEVGSFARRMLEEPVIEISWEMKDEVLYGYYEF